MDAAPLLARIAQLLDRHGLEAVLIGNAAAALQGAPVTTIDIDFLFRKTPGNVRKLKAMASDLDAMVLRPFYPVSGLFRIARDADGLQLDFLSVIDGIRSFEGLRKRARPIDFGGVQLLVAALPDIIKTLKKPRPTRQDKLEALKKESDLALDDQIRRLLALRKANEFPAQTSRHSDVVPVGGQSTQTGVLITVQ